MRPKTLVLIAVIVLSVAAVAILLTSGLWGDQPATVSQTSKNTGESLGRGGGQASRPPPAARSVAAADPTESGRAPQPLQPLQPLPPLNRPLALIYRELRSRATQGDARAACRLAFELERCHEKNSLVANADRINKALEQSKHTGDAARTASLQVDAIARQRQMSDAIQACDGFVEDPRERPPYEYAADAAALGHIPSMIRYVMWPVNFGLQFSPPLATLDGWQVYRERAPQYLEYALAAGAPEAYQARMFLSQFPLWGLRFYPEDPAMALTYAAALRERATAEYAAQLDRDIKRISDEKHLSPDDVSRATAKGHELASRIRSDRPVDFTKGTLGPQDGSHCGG